MIRFQLASTALIVTLKGTPETAGDGCPTFPVALPGAAASPGTRICNFVNGPALTLTAGLELAVLVPSVMSVAVTVQEPAVLLVMDNVFIPASKAVLPGSTSFGSVPLMPTVSITLETKFQLASTAFTVTV